MPMSWSVMLWSRSYTLSAGGQPRGQVCHNMYLRSSMVADVMVLSANLTVTLFDVEASVVTALMDALRRFGTLQDPCDDIPIVEVGTYQFAVTVRTDPWEIRGSVDRRVYATLDRLGICVSRSGPKTSAQSWMTMERIRRFNDRAPHLMMLANSLVSCATRYRFAENEPPTSMFQDEIRLRTLLDLIAWSSWGEDYQAAQAAWGRGVTIAPSWMPG